MNHMQKRTFLTRTAKTLGALVLGATLSATFASGAYAQQSAAGKRFAYLTPGLDLPFWRIVGKGVTDTVKAQGGTVTIYDSHNDAATQLKNAQDAVAQG